MIFEWIFRKGGEVRQLKTPTGGVRDGNDDMSGGFRQIGPICLWRGYDGG